MTLEEARRTLGLAADDDVAEHMAEFVAARDRIADLVRMAPNETIALRYKDGLTEFEQALALIREDQEQKAAALAPTAEPAVAAESPQVEAPPAESLPPPLPSAADPSVPAQPAAPPATVIEEAETKALPPPIGTEHKEPEPLPTGAADHKEAVRVPLATTDHKEPLPAPAIITDHREPVAAPFGIVEHKEASSPTEPIPAATEATPSPSAWHKETETSATPPPLPGEKPSPEPAALADGKDETPASAAPPGPLATEEIAPVLPAETQAAETPPEVSAPPSLSVLAEEKEAAPLAPNVLGATGESDVSQKLEESVPPTLASVAEQKETAPTPVAVPAARISLERPTSKVPPVVIPESKEEEPVAFIDNAEPVPAETKHAIPVAAIPVDEPEAAPKVYAPTKKLEPVAAPAVPGRPLAVEDDAMPAERPKPRRWVAVVVFMLLAAAVAGLLLYQKHEEDMRLQVQEQINVQESLGAQMITARQWPEAEAAFRKIEALSPGSERARLGMRSIEAGKQEELGQFVEYQSERARAEFDQGRLEEAAAAARAVIEKDPSRKDIREMLEKIDQARSTQAREAMLAAATEAIQKRRWDEAETKAKQLNDAFPGDTQAKALLSEIQAGREKEAKDRQRAKELFAAAKVRDQGQFDRDALDWLREAVALAPGDPEIDALYQKMASYTRTLQVPGDFPTLSEAIASARDRDRIVLAEGTWPGPVIIDKALNLEGAGKDKTIIEVEAAASSAASFSRKASGSRVSGITFRHRGFDPGPNRFPVVQVRGAEISMNDCRVADSAGHGLQVMESAHVAAVRCSFENNGWDGVTVHGAGSRIEFSKCEAIGNVGHGYDLWDGGSGSILDSLARDNSTAGIAVDTKGDNVVLGNNELRGNREFGIVLRAAAGGRVHGNQCRDNLLGGIAVRFSAAKVAVENNVLEKNHGPGLALERGLKTEAFATNRATANANGKNTVTDLDFSSGE